MGMTMTQKILARAAGLSQVEAGQLFQVLMLQRQPDFFQLPFCCYGLRICSKSSPKRLFIGLYQLLQPLSRLFPGYIGKICLLRKYALQHFIFYTGLQHFW